MRMAWFRQGYARNMLMTSFDQLQGGNDDLILTSDVDEIPIPNIISKEIASNNFTEDPIVMFNLQYRYKYDFKCREENGDGLSSRIGAQLTTGSMGRKFGTNSFRTAMTCKSVGPYGNCSEEIFQMRRKPCEENCQWHLSSFGGYESYKRKAASISKWSEPVSERSYNNERKSCTNKDMSYPMVPKVVLNPKYSSYFSKYIV